MLTECGLTSRLQVEDPSKTFIGSCTMCKYMKSNKLDQILALLETPNPELEIDLTNETIKNANRSLFNMFEYA